MTNEECRTCRFCVPRIAQPDSFKFLGCTGGEYKAKWIAEIDKCPEPNHEQRKFSL